MTPPNTSFSLTSMFSLVSVSLQQSCSRQLVTVDLNLTNAEFIQFYFMYGCMTPPSNRNQCVLLEFSLNGGINWILLTEIFYDLYRKPGWAFFMKNRYTHTLLIAPSAPTVYVLPKGLRQA